MYPCKIFHYFYKIVYCRLFLHAAAIVDLRKNSALKDLGKLIQYAHIHESYIINSGIVYLIFFAQTITYSGFYIPIKSHYH